MPLIDSKSVQKLVLKNGEMFVPEAITKAIESCVSSSYEEVQQEIDRLKELYKSYIELDKPIEVEYMGDSTIDAYLVNYLPRNTLIPKLLFLSISDHPVLKNVPDKIRILDLGSGTGGIVIGFLDLLRSEHLSHTFAEIICCEMSEPALQRQIKLLNKLKFSNCKVWHSTVDFTEPGAYEAKLNKLAPYDFIVSANLMTELSKEHVNALLPQLPNLLTENGILLLAEPPRIYVNKLVVEISRTLKELGLYQFYPCPPGYQCHKEQCWVWLREEFECPDIYVEGQSITVTNILKSTWGIYCRSSHSMYELLKSQSPSLTWGVAAPFGDELDPVEKMDYEVCTSDGITTIPHIRRKALCRRRNEVVSRGSILGFNEALKPVLSWHPLYKLEL